MPAFIRRARSVASRGLALAASALSVSAGPAPLDVPRASFARWVARRNDRLRGNKLASHATVAPGTQPRIAVVVHAYFTDLLPQLIDSLRTIPVPFDLVVTNASGGPLPLDLSALDRVVNSVVLDVPNQGRDILPLIEVVNADLLEPYELVLKVHTKKSAWRESHETLGGDGAAWRDSFLTDLVGTEEQVRVILSAFAADPTLGLVTANDSILGSDYWGGDEENTAALLRRIELDLVPDALRFAAGSMYWIRGFVLQGLRSLDLVAEDFEEEAGQVDGTTAHAVERAIGILTREAGYRLAEAGAVQADDGDPEYFAPDAPRVPRSRVVPFYLPQFHRFEENDRWWGRGFTEWSNVAAAKPVFHGHRQPMLPSDLGYYDLSSDTVRRDQYALAKAAGIEGFMYYYYWFAGRRLMDGPINQLVASDDDAPFCIMWANENWTRRWDGSERDILIAQDYDEVPAEQFIDDVLDLLKDPRYLRLDGKPLISVYRPTQIPDFERVLAHWRQVAVDAGLGGLSILTVDVGRGMQGIEGDPLNHGIDAYLEFAPHNRRWTSVLREQLSVDSRFQGNILSYAAMVRDAELTLQEPVETRRYPGVMVNFDNTPRRQWQPDLWYGANPYTFRRWLEAAVSAVADRDADHRLVFVNAWNEWAEGAVLEPSQRFGRSYLLATRDVLLR
jgi:lipopolysaccharide biosynthesis protein